LIHRGYLCKEKGEDFVIWGSGTPLRQFIFSIDLAKLMIWTLRSYDEADPIILSVGEADEMTIKDVAYGVSRALGIPDEKVKFDTTKADGQYKKTANNAKLMKLNPDFKFTPFNEAIETTVKWFLENYDKEGGIRK
jgi:GDP-L-fucose synthase